MKLWFVDITSSSWPGGIVPLSNADAAPEAVLLQGAWGSSGCLAGFWPGMLSGTHSCHHLKWKNERI